MEKKYIVKLNEPEKHPADCQVSGLLAWNKQVCVYTRGQALKKSRLFNGAIVRLIEFI